MPELPEVENLRRSLEPWLVGARIVEVDLRRRGVVTLPARSARDERTYRTALGVGGRIESLRRHGKQLLVALDDGRAIVIQLGMTGGVTLEHGATPTGMDGKHRHVLWRVESTLHWPVSDRSPTRDRPSRHRKNQKDSNEPQVKRFVFRDPRRFGGVTAGFSIAEIEERWSDLGRDALTITADQLAEAVSESRRPIKSLLLDQNRIAGIGNIYADESLFAAGIHPERPAASLTDVERGTLARELRRILAAAVEVGGSTLRDYRDAFGRPGEGRQTHLVYGRAGLACVRCATPLLGTRLLGRATVHCPKCQDLSTRSALGKTRVR